MPFLPLMLLGLVSPGLPPQTHNLIRNGDFEEGNSHFSSSLPYAPPAFNCLWPEGYTVTSGFNNPVTLHQSHPTWALVAPKGGNCLFANPSEHENVLLWHQVVRCKSNTKYHISFSVVSIRPEPEWSAMYYIEANGYTSDLQGPGLLTWKTVSYDWNSRESSTARIGVYCPPQLHRRALCGLANITMIVTGAR